MCDHKNCKKEAEVRIYWNDKAYNEYCYLHAVKYLSNSEVLKGMNK